MKNLPFLTILSVVVLAGCDRAPAKQEPPPGKNAPAPAAAQPQAKTPQRVIEQPAFLAPYEETPVVVRVAGYVQKIHCDIGAKVEGPRYDDQGVLTKPGQILAELWVPELVQEHQQKVALVAQAKAEVAQAKGALAAAEAKIATAKAMIDEMQAAVARVQANFDRWDSEYQRVQLLVKQKVIDQQTKEETFHQLQSSKASREEVKAKVVSAKALATETAAMRDKVQADVDAAAAKVKVAQAEKRRLAALLEYAKLRAPFDGVVTQRNVHTGHFLPPGGSGAPPFVVVSTAKVRVTCEVPEVEAPYIQDKMPVKIRVQSLKDREFTGTVQRTSWSLSHKERTLRVEIELPCQGVLVPGMYAYVSFVVPAPAGKEGSVGK